jgi:hypothetical protein
MRWMLERIKHSRVVRVAQATADRYGDDAGGYLAAAIAYYGFLSFFPLILLGVLVSDPAGLGRHAALSEKHAELVDRSQVGLDRAARRIVGATSMLAAICDLVWPAGMPGPRITIGTLALGSERSFLP